MFVLSGLFKKSTQPSISRKARLGFLSHGFPITLKADGNIYSGKVASFTSAEFVVVLYIRDESQSLRQNEPVTVLYLQNDEAYQCDTFVRTVKRNNIVALRYPEKISRTERRIYPRVSIALLLFYAPYDSEKGLVDWDRMDKTSTVDVSAGGVKFVSFRSYPLDTRFCLFFDLETKGQVYYARVVRIEEKEAHYQIAAEFFDISARERANLIEYVNGLSCRGQ